VSLVSLALGVSFAAGACAGGGAGEVRILATKDQDRWTLPLDPYYGPHWVFEMYAVDLLAVDCMAAKGISDVPMIPYNPDAPDTVTFNAVGRRLFNPEIAVRFGYRWDRPQKYDRERALELNRSVSVATGEALRACEADVYRELGIEEQSDWVAGATGQFAPETDPVVIEAAGRWHDCMTGLGVAGLSSDPNSFPAHELMARWGIDANGDGSGGEPVYDSPVAEEVEYAVMDAGCQQSSGWAAAYYEVEWRMQEDYLRKNYDRLERHRVENERREELFRSIIGGTYSGQ
jgi:hypothetical protein